MQPRVTVAAAGFNAMLAKYASVSKKDLAKIINQKAFYIVQKAARFTKVADKAKIRRALKWNKKNADRLRAWALKHRPDLKTDEQRKEWFKKMSSARVKSVAYIKASWTTPFRVLKRAGRVSARNMKGAVQRGKKKGYAKPAKAGWNPAAIAVNTSGAQKGSDKKGRNQLHSQAEAAKRFGEPALRKAYISEKASMKRYIARKMRESARRQRVL